MKFKAGKPQPVRNNLHVWVNMTKGGAELVLQVPGGQDQRLIHIERHAGKVVFAVQALHDPKLCEVLGIEPGTAPELEDYDAYTRRKHGLPPKGEE